MGYRGGERVAARGRRADSRGSSSVGPAFDEHAGPPPRGRTSCRSTRACAGWSTSPRPRRSGWASGSAASASSRHDARHAARLRRQALVADARTPPRRAGGAARRPSLHARARVRRRRARRPTTPAEAAPGFIARDRDAGGFSVEVAPPTPGQQADPRRGRARLSASAATCSPPSRAPRGLEDLDARQHADARSGRSPAATTSSRSGLAGPAVRDFSPEQLDAARRFFLDFVRALGPAADAARRPAAVRAAAGDVARPAHGPARGEAASSRPCAPCAASGAGAARDVPAPRRRDDDARRARRDPAHAAGVGRLPGAPGVRRPVLRARRPCSRARSSRTCEPTRSSCAVALRAVGRPRARRAASASSTSFPATSSQPLAARSSSAAASRPAPCCARTTSPSCARPSFDDMLAERLPDGLPPQGRHAALPAPAPLRPARAGDDGAAHPRPPGRAAGRAATASRCSSTSSAATRRAARRTLPARARLGPALPVDVHTLTAAQEPEAAVLDELRASLALPRDAAGRRARAPPRRLPRPLLLPPRCLDHRRSRRGGCTSSGEDAPRASRSAASAGCTTLRPTPRTPVPAPPAGEDGGPLFAAREPGGPSTRRRWPRPRPRRCCAAAT